MNSLNDQKTVVLHCNCIVTLICYYILLCASPSMSSDVFSVVRNLLHEIGAVKCVFRILNECTQLI